MKTYRPGVFSGFNSQQTASLRAEAQRVKEAMERPVPDLTWEYLHAEPTKIAAGMEVLADGSDWDPGSIGVAGKYRRNEDNTAWELIEATGVAASLAAHLADATDAHDASAISNVPAGTISSTDVQAAINELDSEKQPLDATLTALAAANWSANALPIGSGSDTVSQVSFGANTFPARASSGNLVAKTITDFGLSLVDDADAATARTTLGLGTAATATASALTKTDDTNVTLTLGGTPATALLQATSITVGWSGLLASSRGGTGNGFTKFSGPATAEKTKTLRDANDTILELGGSYTPTGTWVWTSASVTWPTFNQNTTGSAAKWTTPRNLAGNSVDGSANVAFANKFIVQGTADAGLSAAQFLGSLGTGIVKNTTSTGVLSIAVAADFPTLNQNTTGSAATLTTARTIDGQSFDGSANITVIAPGTHAATSKATPVDADELPLVDSAASNVLKKLTWANLKATLKTYLDTLYVSISGALGTPSSGTLTNCTGLPLTGLVATAYSSFSPTISSQTGTITTSSVNWARSLTVGKTVFFTASVTITTVGTASGDLYITLPANCNGTSIRQPVSALNASTGAGCVAYVRQANQSIAIHSTAGAFPAAAGNVIDVSGSYEAA